MRLNKVVLTLPFLVLFLSSCTKKAEAPTNMITLESSASDLFSKSIDVLQSLEFSMNDFDKNAFTAKTDPKDISKEELQNFADLKLETQRYQSGRYSYKISITEIEGKSTIKVEAFVESSYTPTQKESQSGDKFGTNQVWKPEISNGNAEKAFITAIQQ